MSTFVVKVARIRAIEPIEGADVIELAVIGDYRSVVKKDEFKADQLAVYIPEAAVVPLWLLQKIGLEGRLAGKEKNRVKAIKLRGCLSQGIVYPLRGINREKGVMEYYNTASSAMDTITVQEGDNVTPYLGITKYEPAIPAYMSGEVYNADMRNTIAYDIENFKAYPDVFTTGEQVVMTEKLHGTFCGVGILPPEEQGDKHYRGKFVIFSKGLGGKGLCFKDSERNRGNVYFRALEKSGAFTVLETLGQKYPKQPVFILGEVYGKGVQDLAYGSNEVAFRVFDIAAGFRTFEAGADGRGHSTQRYFEFETVEHICKTFNLEMVPVIYKGPFSKDVLMESTKGFETVSGNSVNIREGVVVKPLRERYHADLGRVVLKSVSEDYLLRKGGTEYN